MYTQVHPQQMYELAQQRHHELIAEGALARTEKFIGAPATHRSNNFLAKVTQFAANVGHGRKPDVQTAV